MKKRQPADKKGGRDSRPILMASQVELQINESKISTKIAVYLVDFTIHKSFCFVNDN